MVRYVLSTPDEIFVRGQEMVPPGRNARAQIQRYGFGDLIVDQHNATGPQFHFLYNNGTRVYVISAETGFYSDFLLKDAMYPADPIVNEINAANE